MIRMTRMTRKKVRRANIYHSETVYLKTKLTCLVLTNCLAEKKDKDGGGGGGRRRVGGGDDEDEEIRFGQRFQ